MNTVPKHKIDQRQKLNQSLEMFIQAGGHIQQLGFENKLDQQGIVGRQMSERNKKRNARNK